MKLFGYYALHTLKNQLKKLFKTWVLIFILVCFVVGGLIGFGAAKLEDMAESNDPEQVEVIEEEPDDFELSDEWVDGNFILEIVELIAGAVILGVLLFEVLSADQSGSRIFLPADVNLLFASPLQPQSVLMFRLATQLGAGLFAGLYMLFQLPNLTLNAGLSLGSALSLVGAWCLTLLLGKLIQVLLYTLCSSRPGAKVWLRRGTYIVVGATLAAYLVFWRVSGLDWLPAAARFFNSTPARLLPVWGWIKGFVRSAMDGSAGGVLLYLGLCVLGGGVLAVLIYRVKADFYEDAMAKSEETAELLEQMQSAKSSGLVVRRKKDRSENLRREGFDHGRGASVFFHKALYNRFRFAHFGFLTKTTETYVFTAVALALFLRLVVETDSVLPIALTLAGFAFFRSLGNPLDQDTSMDFFRLIPESMWAKLFFSLLGGTANCLLDVLPALLIGTAILGGDFLQALAWVPFILSVDLYATTVGTFIDLSTPAHAGKTVKQLVQVMFIYFGLLPDVAIIAVGLATDHGVAAVIAAALVNLALALVFFFLTPLFLLPRSVKPIAGAEGVDLREAGKRFSRLGLGAFAYLAATTAIQIFLGIALRGVDPAWAADRPWFMWVVTFGPQYLVGLPLGLLIMRTVPAAPREKSSFGVGRYLSLLPMCVFLMYAGNLVGTAVNALLGVLFPVSAANPLESFAMGTSLPLRILFVVILAPTVEELVFRKTLIDRMHPYGEKLAVVTSAAMFALFHGNFSQMFYAFALGAVFGYVYLKTGKIQYTMGLHIFVNFLGMVVGPAALERADLEALDSGDPAAMFTSGNLIFLAYVAALVILAVVGLVLLCVRSRRVAFEQAELELPRGSRFKTVWINLGMVLLVLACLGLVVFSLI